MTAEQRDLLALPVGSFLDELAAEVPTPGGGAAAALAGALGAALASMVAHYTLGRERFASVADAARASLDRSETLRAALTAGVAADAAAYSALAAAYRLPRGDEAQRAARHAAIGRAARDATAVPLELATRCVELLEVLERLIAVGNPSLISDVGAAAALADGALRALLLNAEVNLPSVADPAFAAVVTQTAARLREQAAQRCAATLERVRAAQTG